MTMIDSDDPDMDGEELDRDEMEADILKCEILHTIGMLKRLGRRFQYMAEDELIHPETVGLCMVKLQELTWWFDAGCRDGVSPEIMALVDQGLAEDKVRGVEALRGVEPEGNG